MYRGRLAPSPTGAQHLGNARTHLIAFWAARQAGGELVLRIDDLDSPRTKHWAIDQAIEDLRWLGIDWDDGPHFQTRHSDAYQQALQQLIRADHVYPCTCSRREIEEAASAPHENRFYHEGPIYPGTCAAWRNGMALPAKDYCWRYRATDRTLEFDDLVLGRHVCNPAAELGDFPVTQKHGGLAYQLAVCIDDQLAEVTDVVRGNDLIASTFRQLDLFQTLGSSVPRYAHVPLVRGADDRRLAKRHGDTRLSHYRENSVSAEAIVGWAAHSLGLIDRPEPCSAIDLVDELDWSKLPTEDTRVDTERLFQT